MLGKRGPLGSPKPGVDPDEFNHAEDIPFPETRAYVENVMWRDNYADDLGL